MIISTFNKLKTGEFKEWSISDVPFNIYDSKFFTMEHFLNTAGRALEFAYNYEGLYRFKNKFRPEWRGVSVCTKPRLGISTAIKVGWKSNLISLIFSQLNIL